MNIAHALKNFVARKLTKDNLKAIEAEQDRIVAVTEYLQSELTSANEAIQKHRKAELDAIASAANSLQLRTMRLAELTTDRKEERKKLVKLSDALDSVAIASFDAVAA